MKNGAIKVKRLVDCPADPAGRTVGVPTNGRPYSSSCRPCTTLGFGIAGGVWFVREEKRVSHGDALASAKKQKEACWG